MTVKQDERTGRFVIQYRDEVFFNALAELKMASTREVAERVGCSYELAYRRLNDLHKRNKVMKKPVGNSILWYLEGSL